MTSVIPEPRIDVGRVSPRTQRTASTTLLLPHPFGPTMPVRVFRPKSMTVRSAKDLKPKSSRRLRRMEELGAGSGERERTWQIAGPVKRVWFQAPSDGRPSRNCRSVSNRLQAAIPGRSARSDARSRSRPSTAESWPDEGPCVRRALRRPGTRRLSCPRPARSSGDAMSSPAEVALRSPARATRPGSDSPVGPCQRPRPEPVGSPVVLLRERQVPEQTRLARPAERGVAAGEADRRAPTEGEGRPHVDPRARRRRGPPHPRGSRAPWRPDRPWRGHRRGSGAPRTGRPARAPRRAGRRGSPPACAGSGRVGPLARRAHRARSRRCRADARGTPPPARAPRVGRSAAG